MAKSKALYVQPLAAIRAQSKLTQEQLSKRSGVSLGRIRSIETGLTAITSKERRALARALKVKVDELQYPKKAGPIDGVDLLDDGDVEQAYRWLGIDPKLRRELAEPIEPKRPEWSGWTTLQDIFGEYPSGWSMPDGKA